MEAEEYFHILIYAALVDGVLQDEELPLLEAFAERLGLSRERAAEVFERARKGRALSYEVPSSEKDRRTLFRHVARIVAADQRLASAEKSLLLHFGTLLGLNKREVAEGFKRAIVEAKASD